jgi:hypothetical protein
MEDIPGFYVMYTQGLPDEESEASSEVEQLMKEFEAHEAKEEKSLDQYKKLMEEAKNPLTKFLVRLILSDEEKHRAVTHAMVSTLKAGLTWTRPEDAIEDFGDFPSMNGKVLALTDEFIRLEREGIKGYKNLMEKSKGYYHGLFGLLLQSMIHDSEKHLSLLEFLRDRLRED